MGAAREGVELRACPGRSPFRPVSICLGTSMDGCSACYSFGRIQAQMTWFGGLCAKSGLRCASGAKEVRTCKLQIRLSGHGI